MRVPFDQASPELSEQENPIVPDSALDRLFHLLIGIINWFYANFTRA